MFYLVESRDRLTASWYSLLNLRKARYFLSETYDGILKNRNISPQLQAMAFLREHIPFSYLILTYLCQIYYLVMFNFQKKNRS